MRDPGNAEQAWRRRGPLLRGRSPVPSRNGRATRPTWNSEREAVVRIQSTHHHADRGFDAYFSPPVAVASLLQV